jgi:hypothetical protein
MAIREHGRRTGFVDQAQTEFAEGEKASGSAKPERCGRSQGDESQLGTDSKEVSFNPVGERLLRSRFLGGKDFGSD